MTDVNELVRRLDAVRDRAQKLNQDKTRLEGELVGCNKLLEQYSLECKEKFGIDIEEIEKEKDKLLQEAEADLIQIEKDLSKVKDFLPS